ncbi:hypothetical protein K6U06_06495 [Acidiferrimicrobium sp. IK]|uniref:hypothetical protein n=1 Tax=Acidiferrimicrobium sp. IK TaxID=2871700 RepID=UPI0021CAEF6F|nr:hypothetical protein [Acidiferrimicrobium sp. IK]MCU4184002.1 hypothetical protein [Acidiferrimicrobium sp. IK]
MTGTVVPCGHLPLVDGLRAIPGHTHRCDRHDHDTRPGPHLCTCGEQWENRP